MILTAKMINAKDALKWGLINYLGKSRFFNFKM